MLWLSRGGRGSRLYELTNLASKAALYFCGKISHYWFSSFLIVINSGIRRIVWLRNTKSHPLFRHLVARLGTLKKNGANQLKYFPPLSVFLTIGMRVLADGVFPEHWYYSRLKVPKICISYCLGDHIYRMDYGSLIPNMPNLWVAKMDS